jgi:hypothetical protein
VCFRNAYELLNATLRAEINTPEVCAKGHPLTPENLHVDEREGRWRCRQCGRERDAAFRMRQDGGVGLSPCARGYPWTRTSPQLRKWRSSDDSRVAGSLNAPDAHVFLHLEGIVREGMLPAPFGMPASCWHRCSDLQRSAPGPPRREFPLRSRWR